MARQNVLHNINKKRTFVSQKNKKGFKQWQDLKFPW